MTPSTIGGIAIITVIVLVCASLVFKILFGILIIGKIASYSSKK